MFNTLIFLGGRKCLKDRQKETERGWGLETTKKWHYSHILCTSPAQQMKLDIKKGASRQDNTTNIHILQRYVQCFINLKLNLYKKHRALCIVYGNRVARLIDERKCVWYATENNKKKSSRRSSARKKNYTKWNIFITFWRRKFFFATTYCNAHIYLLNTYILLYIPYKCSRAKCTFSRHVEITVKKSEELYTKAIVSWAYTHCGIY